MQYKMERYKNHKRFNEQYQDIYKFLLEAEAMGFNEHFHWGRFEWMHQHTALDEEKLTEIKLFRDESNTIVGMLTHDTSYKDRVYLIHTSTDKQLLNQMVDDVCESEDSEVVIKANAKDSILTEVLQERQFVKQRQDVSVLKLDLSKELEYRLPEGYLISQPGFVTDRWQYQLVIHKGFGNTGIPKKWDDDIFARFSKSTDRNAVIHTFVIRGDEYCSHCGLWYTKGDTAYIEPVATVPQHRKLGLAKAAIYEACKQAKKRGAKRAIVLSDQEFYYKIGFVRSSEVYRWEKCL